MTVPVVLSASSLNTYLRCGHQWYLAYIVQLRQPPSVRQVIGIAAHSAIEHNFAQKLVTRTDVSATEMTDVFSDNYDGLVADVEKPDEDVGDAKDDGIKLVTKHRAVVSPSIQPIWVEHEGQAEVDGVPFSYTVDLADDKGRVRDAKTTARRPDPTRYFLQMTGYALGYRHEMGELETDTVVDALVRTKVPQYIPIYNGGPVSDRHIARFANTLQAAYNGIDRGDFIPNGLQNGACSWCGFRSACKYQSE